MQKSPPTTTTPTLRGILTENLFWFLGSLALAVLVWMIAVSQSDPVEQWRVNNLPIRVMTDSGLIITEQSENAAAAQMLAQRSVRLALAPDDIIISVDLRGLGPGTHIVPLQWNTARRATVLDTIPRQITITTEIEESRLKPVEAIIQEEPPLDYRRGEPQIDVLQATVSGPLSLVEQVDTLQVTLDLSDQRSAYQDTVRLIPVDVDGAIVEGVTVEPQNVTVTVSIEPRDDVRPMRVLANTSGDLPEGYRLTGFDYEPQSVYVSGSPEILSTLGDTLFTEPIDFSDRVSSFEITVPILIPNPDLLLIPRRDVTVTVTIEAQIATRQIDRVPVEVIGITQGRTVQLAPTEVTVLVTGPQPQIEPLTASDISVIVDVSRLRAGDNTQITPITSFRNGMIANATIQVLPAAIDVRVLETLEVTSEVTPAEGSATPTPISTRTPTPSATAAP